MNRKEFFAAVRVAPFGGALNAEQVQGINAVLDEWDLRGLTDTRQLAYMLATDYHETAYTMQAVEEIGKGRGKKYGRADKRTGQVYYGRGLVQLTWYDNYRDMGQLLGLDLLHKPELALNLDIAVQIMFEGMIRGTFTGKKLSTYFTAAKSDWRNARKIINGLDKADAIAGYAKAFHRALVKADSAPAESEPDDAEQEPTTVVSAEVRGDPELWSVQKRLRDMNYPPGELDGAWGGMTAGAISAFINDRELDITAPTSLVLFRQVEDPLKEALSAAEAAHFKRPVSADRAHASAADIAPRFAAVQQTTRSRFWAKVQTIGASISAAFWAAIEWLQSNDHTGPIVDAVQRVPRWAWAGTAIVAVTVISGMIWRSQRKAEQAVIDQYREGKLQT